MLYQNARVCLLWTLLGLVLATLSGCASGPRVIYKDRLIQVPTPVIQPLDPRLTEDCTPASSVPMSGALTVRDILDRLEAVEYALARCNNDKAEIRKVSSLR